jgi:putative transposase
VKGEVFLGGERFVETMRDEMARRRTLSEIPRQQRYADRPTLSVLFGKGPSMTKAERDRLIHQAHVQHGYSLAAISWVLGLHYTTISKVVKAEMKSSFKTCPLVLV